MRFLFRVLAVKLAWDRAGALRRVEVPTGLDGRWRVRRVSGIIPPLGVQKVISGNVGTTTLLGLPVGKFDVEGTTLRYRRWPIRDQLSDEEGGSLRGVGLLGDRPFGVFLMKRIR